MVKLKLKQRGFTIVELLIATSVFSIVLLLATISIIQIGKTYYKGINSSQTQATARAIIDEISQAIQQSGGSSNNTPTASSIGPTQVRYFCTSLKRYTYVYQPANQPLQDSPSSHGFVSDNYPEKNGGACVAPSAWSRTGAGHWVGEVATEMLQPRMRVAYFSLIQTAMSLNLYQVDVRVVFGENDLLCNTSVAGECNSNAAAPVGDLADNNFVSCKDHAGAQFCGVAALSTSVEKRLSN